MKTSTVLTVEEKEFLRESNLIENVSDVDSFQQAAYAWDYLRPIKKLDHGVILRTHKILMLHQNIRPDQRGYYRTKNVGIYGEQIIGIEDDRFITERFLIRKCLDYKKIREKMTGWIFLVQDKIDEVHDIEGYIKESHVHFEEIHPFIDGNGRIGRMLMNWQRLQVGLPILIIKNADKNNYYKWFTKEKLKNG